MSNDRWSTEGEDHHQGLGAKHAKLGRCPHDPPDYTGRAVDVAFWVIPDRSGPIAGLREWLAGCAARHADPERHPDLAHEPVVLIHPDLGTIAWDPGRAPAPRPKTTGHRKPHGLVPQPHLRSRPPRRRARQPVKRRRTVRFDLSDEEFSELSAAADRAGLARGAFAAQVALLAARSGMVVAESPLREALGEFVRAAGLVRRIGVNLNQAVAKLNATGQRSGDLLPYAAESIRRAQLLDQAAEEVRKQIRR
jgi:hypothetical protein